MLTLPAATPFTVMVIPLTDTVAFCFIRRHRTEALVGYAFRLECHGQRGALPSLRKHWLALPSCRLPLLLCCDLQPSTGVPIGDLHRAGDHFLRRHRLTDTADPATEHRPLPFGKRIL